MFLNFSSGTSSSTAIGNVVHEEPLEPDDKNQLIENNPVDPNPYSELWMERNL